MAPAHAVVKRGLVLAGAALVTIALCGCSERLVGYTASYNGTAGFGVQAEPPEGAVVRLRMRKTGVATDGGTTYARPGGAVLKLPGYLPAYPLSVDEGPTEFVVAIPLPEDALAVAQDGPLHGVRLHGELLLPYDTGIRSFTGIERFVPSSSAASVSLTPIYAGPLTTLARNFGGFLRGLYSAR